MHSALTIARCWRVAVLACLVATASATAGELMPTAQQNALVHKYCAVCHTDAAQAGGLTLEHFDAAQVSPSLAAMLLSKLTGGVSLKTAREASSNASAAALVDQKMRSGAMGASGIPRPDHATIAAQMQALAAESAGATEWSVERRHDAALTASMLREAPSSGNAGEARVYRLIASCNPATQAGELQLAWAPMAQEGNLSASVDGHAATPFRAAGSSGVLAASKRGASRTGLPFPAEWLRISDLFPGETVTFSFGNLPRAARQAFNACFPGAD